MIENDYNTKDEDLYSALIAAWVPLLQGEMVYGLKKSDVLNACIGALSFITTSQSGSVEDVKEMHAFLIESLHTCCPFAVEMWEKNARGEYDH